MSLRPFAIAALLSAAPLFSLHAETPAANTDATATTVESATEATAETTPTPAPTVAPAATPATDAQIQTRADALEVAGAFTNDEFVIRDGHWWDTASADKPAVIQVNLFAGNQYWFVAAASPEAKKVSVTIFDEKGQPVAFEPYENENRAAAGFSPEVSGPYYVRIATEEETPSTVCLVYSYK